MRGVGARVADAALHVLLQSHKRFGIQAKRVVISPPLGELRVRGGPGALQSHHSGRVDSQGGHRPLDRIGELGVGELGCGSASEEEAEADVCMTEVHGGAHARSRAAESAARQRQSQVDAQLEHLPRSRPVGA